MKHQTHSERIGAMTKYTDEYSVRELQNAQSHTDGYDTIEAASLTEAKRKASRMQAFQGTVLELSSNETGVILSRKTDGRWIDC